MENLRILACCLSRGISLLLKYVKPSLGVGSRGVAASVPVSYITQSRLNKTSVKSHDLMLQWLYFLNYNPFICMCVYSGFTAPSVLGRGKRMFETFCKGFAISSGLLKLRIQWVCVHSCEPECPFMWAFLPPPPFCCFYAKASHMVAFGVPSQLKLSWSTNEWKFGHIMQTSFKACVTEWCTVVTWERKR